MPVEVRPALPDDWATWRALRLEALEDTPLGFVETLEAARAKDEAAWRRRMQEVPCSAPAYDAGRAVGMASGFLVDGRPFLGAVYVTPSARGREVLPALVDAVLGWVRGTGADAVLLEVHEDNPRARAAYARLGFVEMGERRPYPLGPDRDELVMLRRL